MADLTLSDLVRGKKPPANRKVGDVRALLGQGLGMGWGMRARLGSALN